MKHFSIIYILIFTFSISFAQINWKKYEHNPVLTHGTAGAWDSLYIQHSSVVFDGTRYQMYYTGRSVISNQACIGHAMSDDGISWEKDSAHNPVLEPGTAGEWDDEYVGISSASYDGSVFHMWYTGGKETTSLYRIGYATSPDGFTWTKYNNASTTNPPYAESDPVLTPSAAGRWDSHGVEAPTVIQEGDSYTMWYNGYTNSFKAQIGRATSTNGINWIKDTANNPVLYPGSALTWEESFIRQGCVVFDQKNSAYLFFYYAGEFYKHFNIGYAWSSDGIVWTKYSKPVLPLGSTGSWDDAQVMGPWVILDSDTLRMWYTGADTTYPPASVISGIGYATIPLETLLVDGIDKYAEGNIPGRYSLSQNYPNPFNPRTNINYELPITNYVDLSIYNLLGQKVVTLVDKKQTAGRHQVQWDASGFASGVYIYKLRAMDQRQNVVLSKKLLLLK